MDKHVQHTININYLFVIAARLMRMSIYVCVCVKCISESWKQFDEWFKGIYKLIVSVSICEWGFSRLLYIFLFGVRSDLQFNWFCQYKRGNIKKVESIEQNAWWLVPCHCFVCICLSVCLSLTAFASIRLFLFIFPNISIKGYFRTQHLISIKFSL